MAKGTLTVKLGVDGVRECLAAFNRLDRDANAELRQASGQIAARAVPIVQAAAGTGQQRSVARAVKVLRDRVPVVQAGNAKVAPYLAGSEFGSDHRRTATYHSRTRAGTTYLIRDRHTTRQFPSPHTGTQGLWFFPTFERLIPMMLREWVDAVDRLLDRWGSGG